MKKMFLEADPNQVEIKKLLGKDFLELSMRTVSSANPNRNGSWFTKEAQEKALASYDNKPILAYFENGDFVSHNGEWKNDPNTGMDFWDTLITKGERPIGTIREKDRKEVVLDEATGLYWTEITCILWTQYSYRQVLRLIKDAQEAAKNGGPTKSISVEVDITDYEELPDGVLKINDYVLQGITILGSRNGKKVEPGIAGAQLTVLDVVSSELYARQNHALMQAYEALDAVLQNKEEKSMDPTMKLDENGNPIEETKPADQTTAAFESGEQKPEKEPEETTPEETTPEETTPEEKQKSENFEEEDPEGKEVTKSDVICDLAWMIESLNYRLCDYDNTIKHYEEIEVMPGKKLVINTLKRMRACMEEEIAELGKLLALVSAEDFVEDEEREQFEEELCKNCRLSEVYTKLLETEKECKTFKEKCEKFEEPCPECGENPCVCEKKKLEALQAEFDKMKEEKEKLEFSAFMEKATSVIESAKGHLGDEFAAALKERCEKKEIKSFEALESEIALAVGKATLANDKSKNAYSAPIPTFARPEDGKTAEVQSKDPFVRSGYKAKK